MKRSKLPRLIIGCVAILGLWTASLKAGTLLYATTRNPTNSATAAGILRIDENGNSTTWNINWGGNPYSLQNPQGIDLDGSGNVYVNDGSNIYKITPAGNGSLFATKPNANNAFGLAIDNAGNVYATGRSGSLDVIYRYNAAGDLTATWNGSAHGLEAGADGRVYAADPVEGRIWRYDSAGARSLWLSESGVWDLAFDPDGHLFVSMQNHYVNRLGSNGIAYYTVYSSGSMVAGAMEAKGDKIYIGASLAYDNEIRFYRQDGHSDTFANLDEEHQVNFIVAVPEPGVANLVLVGAFVMSWRRRGRGR